MTLRQVLLLIAAALLVAALTLAGVALTDTGPDGAYYGAIYAALGAAGAAAYALSMMRDDDDTVG